MQCICKHNLNFLQFVTPITPILIITRYTQMGQKIATLHPDTCTKDRVLFTITPSEKQNIPGN